MTERSCRDCRFSSAAGLSPTHARCDWVDGTEDEAGDRMPAWAHAILMQSIPLARGPMSRAEHCPAFERRSS